MENVVAEAVHSSCFKKEMIKFKQFLSDPSTTSCMYSQLKTNILTEKFFASRSNVSVSFRNRIKLIRLWLTLISLVGPKIYESQCCSQVTCDQRSFNTHG